jgi:Rrf2 family protein
MSESASLAFHAMAILARHPAQRLSTPDLADELGTSSHTLGKVMALLVRAGLVDGCRGRSGGFLLAKPATSIVLPDIYECVEGRFVDTLCLFRRPGCDGGSCLLSSLMQNLVRQARAVLGNTSLQVLAGDAKIGDKRWQERDHHGARQRRRTFAKSLAGNARAVRAPGGEQTRTASAPSEVDADSVRGASARPR